MPELNFKEWVEQKAKGADAGRAERVREWRRAYEQLRTQIESWLKEDGGERIQIVKIPVMTHERDLGIYQLDAIAIHIGDSSVKVEPVSRKVIARINPPEGGELPGEGLVDVSSGGTTYHLYRSIQDGKDVWYIVDERRYRPGAKQQGPDTPLTREGFQEILMDLMS